MKTKTAEKTTEKQPVLVNQNNEINNSTPATPSTGLTIVKKRMTVEEKLDSFLKLEAMYGKVEYLRKKKQDIDKFGSGSEGFQGAKIAFKCDWKEEFEVKCPTIIEELTKICRSKIKEVLIKAEKEVEEFEMY
jgi:hypothetical protein